MTLQQITEGMTGQQAANVIYANDNENLSKTQELEGKLPEVIQGKNLFNPATVQVDKYLNNSGVIQTSAGWKCSAFIPVTVGQSYTLSGNKLRVGLAFYDSSYNPVRYLSINLGTVTAQSGEAFVAFNLESPTQPGYTNIQFELGPTATDYVPFGSVVKKEAVEGLVGAINNAQMALDATAKLDAFDVEELTSDNIFNPNTILYQTLVNQSTGALLTGTSVTDQYNTTDLLPVEQGETYTGINLNGANLFRQVAFYNALGVFVSGVTGWVNSFVAPVGVSFVRVSVEGDKPVEGFGLFKGTSPTWQPYEGGFIVKLNGDNIPAEDKDPNAVATIKDVQALAGQTALDATVNYNLSATGILTLTYPFGTIVGRVKEARGFSGNNMFNFASFNLAGVSSLNNDDVAPMHAFGTTVGANHGPAIYNATINSHGLANVDIGTAWQNSSGVNFYVMRIVNADTVAFLSQNNGTADVPAFVALTAGNLTKSGNTLTVSAVSAEQMYPAINNLKRRVMVNGVTEITDGAGVAGYIDVVESYDLMTQNSVLQAAIARAGSSAEPDYTAGEGALRVENIYRFVPGATCIVINTFKALRAVQFADIMVSQSARFGTNGVTEYYVPNSNPLNGSVDLRTPTAVNWSASIPSTFVNNSSQPDPNNPPNRVISYFQNLGFSLGYIKTRGVGKALNTYTARTFEIRNNTGKIYPHALEDAKVGNPIPSNTIVNTVMFRSYTNLAQTRVGNRLSVFSFEFEGATYAYIDYSGNMQDFVNLGRPSLNGKLIEVLESKNTTLSNDTYNDGLHVTAQYTAGETCYLVVRIR